jgi:hypothetical protein
MFYSFILERVTDDNKEAAQKLLQDRFTRQESGNFTREYLLETQAKLLKMLKPEANKEVKEAMAHFASQIKL